MFKILQTSTDSLDTLKPVDQLQHSFIVVGILHDKFRLAVYSQKQRTAGFLDFPNHFRRLTLKLAKRVDFFRFVRHRFCLLAESSPFVQSMLTFKREGYKDVVCFTTFELSSSGKNAFASS